MPVKSRKIKEMTRGVNCLFFFLLNLFTLSLYSARLRAPCELMCISLGQSGTNKSVTRVDSLVPLMYHKPTDLRSLILIQITPNEYTFNVCLQIQTRSRENRAEVRTCVTTRASAIHCTLHYLSLILSL